MILAAGAAETAAPLLELGVVLVIVATLARLASRVGLSPIPLYLLAGLFLGSGSPFGLDASDAFIEVAATLGVVLLLFFLGLEYTPDELITSLRMSAGAGVVDLLNAVPGIVLGLLLGWSPLAAVVLGGITYISSSGVIAKTLADLGRLGNRETPTILSILVIEDLAMAIYLPIVAGLLAGGAALTVGVNVVVGIGLVMLVLFAASRYGQHVSRFLFSRSDEVVLFSILSVVFLVAGAAERIGVSAGVGAFLVGIALSGPAQRSAETLIAPLRDLFAAAFFIFFTFQIDASTLPDAILPAVLLAVVTGLLKVFTGWWSARQVGIGRAGRLRTGLTLIARGEFSIVIAGIAVANGLESDLGPLAATYVLLLAIAGPVLTRADELIGRIGAPAPTRAPAAQSPHL
jgi:monovalent cation:H+ antiporter-2, CPA2 family